MSTASEREAALRRALQSAAEYIEPAPGGLERIQKRLRRPRPMLVAQLEAAGTVVLMRAPDVIEAVRQRAANVLRLVWDRFGPKTAGQGPLRWLRPLAAMCVAVFVIGAGVYVGLANPLPLPTGVLLGGGAGATGTHPGGRADSGAGTPLGGGSPSSYPTALNSSGRTPACPKPKPRFQAPTSSPASTSTSPTATTTSPSSGTSSSSPSPSDSTTPSPGSSTPSAGSGAAPDAGVTSGNLASAGANAQTGINGSPARRSEANTNASQSAPSRAPRGKGKPSSSSPKYNPCHSPKPTSTPAKNSSSPSTATQTSAKLAHTQPGKAVAAKLD